LAASLADAAHPDCTSRPIEALSRPGSPEAYSWIDEACHGLMAAGWLGLNNTTSDYLDPPK